jgi:exopolyphosphatase / guanosine-5'-triphosphate,3'-diphosphate pyrophosphatase
MISGGRPEIVAGVDCGTNSLRLLVAEARDGEFTELHRELNIVRLGEAVAETGRFSEAALQRTDATLADYATTIRRFGAERVRFVATSAARDAANRDRLVDVVRRRLGIEAEIVSGAEEAALSLRGALAMARGRPLGTAVLVVDIGGGSTELVVGAVGQGVPGAAVSLDIGCVRLTELYLHDDPPTADQADALRRAVYGQLDTVEPGIRAAAAGLVVGVAGTVTTIGALARGLAEYDRSIVHGTELTTSDIARTTERLVRAGHAERAAMTVIHPGRVDVITAGALILSCVVDWGQVRRVVVSESDLLDAIAASTLD